MPDVIFNDIKLGKLPARIDVRTLKMARLFIPRLLPPLPATFDVDSGLQATIQTSVFANDNWGCCVISGRANWTLRAEQFEQGYCLSITDQEVLNEYWAEQGGNAITRPDNGLVMLTSLNLWRHLGWIAATQHHKIYGYAAINWKNHTELKYAIFLLGGVYTGFLVPNTAMTQFQYNQVWDVVPGAYEVGGHAIYIVGYNDTGPVCLTWGKRQQMTWAFFDKYTDEAYAMIDDKNEFTINSPVNIPLLTAYLANLKEENPPSIIASITYPNGEVDNSIIITNSDGSFQMKFVAKMVGRHVIDVDYIDSTATLYIDVIR